MTCALAPILTSRLVISEQFILQLLTFINMFRSQDRSVGIATGYGLHGRFDSRH
jgi:hypothetical protein